MGKTKIWVGKNGSKEGCGYDIKNWMRVFQILSYFCKRVNLEKCIL